MLQEVGDASAGAVEEGAGGEWGVGVDGGGKGGGGRGCDCCHCGLLSRRLGRLIHEEGWGSDDMPRCGSSLSSSLLVPGQILVAVLEAGASRLECFRQSIGSLSFSNKAKIGGRFPKLWGALRTLTSDVAHNQGS